MIWRGKCSRPALTKPRRRFHKYQWFVLRLLAIPASAHSGRHSGPSASQQEHRFQSCLPDELEIVLVRQRHFFFQVCDLDLDHKRTNTRFLRSSVSYEASVHCVFDEAHDIVMSVVLLLITLAIEIAHGLPLNSPLLPTYDYIGKQSYQPEDLDAQQRQSSEAVQPALPSPTASPKIQVSTCSFLKPAQ